MYLNQWIDDVGGINAASEILKEKPRTVRSWYFQQRAPRLPAAFNIVWRSKRKVDFNGIYTPFVARVVRQ